jgi:hypothetical protein
MTIMDTLKKHWTSLISILLLLLVILPFIQPLSLPFTVSDMTMEYYDQISTLKPGDTVLMTVDVKPSSYSNIAYQTVATLYNMWSRGVKTVIWSTEVISTLSVERVFNERTAQPDGLEYGTDWIYLGYIPGMESAMASMVDDIWSLTSTDAYGNTISTLPLASDISKLTDFDFIYACSDGSTTLIAIVRQWTGQGVPLGIATTATNIHHILPYYPSDIESMVIDVTGAAELERLINRPYTATALQDAINLVQLFVACLIILGNIALYTKKQGGKK